MKYSLSQTIAELETNAISYKLNAHLALLTTWKIGGPADILIEATSEEQLKKLVSIAQKTDTPLTVIGSGSNILISDAGIRGIVIHNQLKSLLIDDTLITETQSEQVEVNLKPRLTQIDTAQYYSFAELHFDESNYDTTRVKVGSGYYLPLLINVLIDNGITGLQWFSGIPGTIGGAVYNNIHGGDHFMSEYIESVTILNSNNEIITLPKSELDFEYDFSRFHNTKEIILAVTLKLYKGDKTRARNAAIAWAQKKKLQPYKSAGCCFKNLTDTEVSMLKLPTGSWGYIIDKVLGLKGITIGDAKISEKHAAFIENVGKATAADVLALFDLIYTTANKKLGVQPKTEIFLLGFDKAITKRYN